MQHERLEAGPEYLAPAYGVKNPHISGRDPEPGADSVLMTLSPFMRPFTGHLREPIRVPVMADSRIGRRRLAE
jgi:hypothetical protein